MFNWTLNQEMMRLKRLSVVTEAPNETDVDTGVTSVNSPAEKMGSTDYDAAAAEMDDADLDGKPDPGTESADNDVEDMDADDYNEEDTGDETGEEDTGDETGEEDTGDETGDDMEADDYNEEDTGDETGEEDTDEETTEEEEVPEQTGDKSKNRFLIREYINLYYGIENLIKKLNNKSKTDSVSNEIYFKVTDNLNKVNTLLYEYIRDDFSNKSYVFNLYQFNLFLEYININAEILSNCNELESNKQTNK